MMPQRMKVAPFVVRVESVASDSPPEELVRDLCDFANLIGALVSCDVNGKMVVIAAGADPEKEVSKYRLAPKGGL